MFNHQEPWDNWAEMCFSTPSEFAWKSFAHPDTCENKVSDVPSRGRKTNFLIGKVWYRWNLVHRC